MAPLMALATAVKLLMTKPFRPMALLTALAMAVELLMALATAAKFLMTLLMAPAMVVTAKPLWACFSPSTSHDAWKLAVWKWFLE